MEERCQTAMLYQEDGYLVEGPWTGAFRGKTRSFYSPSGAKVVNNGDVSELLGFKYQNSTGKASQVCLCVLWFGFFFQSCLWYLSRGVYLPQPSLEDDNALIIHESTYRIDQKPKSACSDHEAK